MAIFYKKSNRQIQVWQNKLDPNPPQVLRFYSRFYNTAKKVLISRMQSFQLQSFCIQIFKIDFTLPNPTRQELGLNRECFTRKINLFYSISTLLFPTCAHNSCWLPQLCSRSSLAENPNQTVPDRPPFSYLEKKILWRSAIWNSQIKNSGFTAWN